MKKTILVIMAGIIFIVGILAVVGRMKASDYCQSQGFEMAESMKDGQVLCVIKHDQANGGFLSGSFGWYKYPPLN